MKTCRDCNRIKPYDDYYKHSEMADGYLNKCKDCVKKRVSRYRQKNIDNIRENDRVRGMLPHRVQARKEYANTERGKAVIRACKQKWAERNPKKRKAHVALSNAKRDGKIQQGICAVCGNIKAEAHHEDYSNPLDVIWLCDFHHKQRHKELRGLA